jgi:hypothetical protein
MVKKKTPIYFFYFIVDLLLNFTKFVPFVNPGLRVPTTHSLTQEGEGYQRVSTLANIT